jgi:thiamine kinase-like enzyme
MIPLEKQPAVARALEAAFGVREYEAIAPLTADDGLSFALVYRIEVAGRPYLLRFVKETMPGVDPAREFEFMQRAAEADVAPRVWYANVEHRVMVSDIVDVKPYPADAAPRLASTLSRLHGLAGFASTTNYADAMDGFVKRLAGADLLPRNTMDELLRGYEQAAAVYPRDPADWVPCHHDLKPQNMLYDGERFRLIDWEAAFLDDRYVDLAVAANFVANTDVEADAFLAAYFGHPPNDVQRARLFLMSQRISAFYVAVFGLIAARAGLSWEPDSEVPSFVDLHRRIVAGEADLSTPEAKRMVAHVHLNKALADMKSQRFSDAVALLAAQSSKLDNP